MGAQWVSGRVLDSRLKGRGFEPHRRHCVVSLSKNINPSLVLVQPRKTRPFITERLLMVRKESNQSININLEAKSLNSTFRCIKAPKYNLEKTNPTKKENLQNKKTTDFVIGKCNMYYAPKHQLICNKPYSAFCQNTIFLKNQNVKTKSTLY